MGKLTTRTKSWELIFQAGSNALRFEWFFEAVKFHRPRVFSDKDRLFHEEFYGSYPALTVDY